MKPDRYVLDTSALFSYMEDEPGSAFVEQVLNDPKSSVLIPWPVLYEVYYIEVGLCRGEPSALAV